MKKILAVLFIILMLSGCAEPLQEGVILSSKFVPEDTGTMMISDGSTFIFVPTYDPPMWYLYVRNDELDRAEWVRVSRETYDAAKIGYRYRRN